MNSEHNDYILFGLIFTFIYLKYENICNKNNIEKMSNIDEILNQINSIYKVDISSIKNLSDISKILQYKDNLIIPGNIQMKGNLSITGTCNYIPTGLVIAFNGLKPPIGWAVCDGKNNTPDLRGRFIVGYNNDPKLEYNKIGNKGGKDKHKLSINELPKHTHVIKSEPNHTHSYNLRPTSKNVNNTKYLSKARYNHNGGPTKTSATGKHNHGGKTGNTGKNKALENRPKYYVLMYIMKVDPSINKDTLEKKLGGDSDIGGGNFNG
jgi:microcystin-dependent protein|uniref:Phage tail collar domain-containing protein n=1 Tax=viral metagenome TaxID=1070528 RepID=A0A6C0IWJ8_9ZZZZ